MHLLIHPRSLHVLKFAHVTSVKNDYTVGTLVVHDAIHQQRIMFLHWQWSKLMAVLQHPHPPPTPTPTPLHINNLSAILGLVSCSRHHHRVHRMLFKQYRTSISTHSLCEIMNSEAGLLFVETHLFDLLDGESYLKKVIMMMHPINTVYLTRGEGLSQLVGLGLVLDNQGVEVARASDLELDRISILLDASSCWIKEWGSCEWECIVIELNGNTYTWRPFCGQFRGTAWYP